MKMEPRAPKGRFMGAPKVDLEGAENSLILVSASGRRKIDSKRCLERSKAEKVARVVHRVAAESAFPRRGAPHNGLKNDACRHMIPHAAGPANFKTKFRGESG